MVRWGRASFHHSVGFIWNLFLTFLLYPMWLTLATVLFLARFSSKNLTRCPRNLDVSPYKKTYWFPKLSEAQQGWGPTALWPYNTFLKNILTDNPVKINIIKGRGRRGNHWFPYKTSWIFDPTDTRLAAFMQSSSNVFHSWIKVASSYPVSTSDRTNNRLK